jgi:hypothetical protein
MFVKEIQHKITVEREMEIRGEKQQDRQQELSTTNTRLRIRKPKQVEPSKTKNLAPTKIKIK